MALSSGKITSPPPKYGTHILHLFNCYSVTANDASFSVFQFQGTRSKKRTSHVVKCMEHNILLLLLSNVGITCSRVGVAKLPKFFQENIDLYTPYQGNFDKSISLKSIF